MEIPFDSLISYRRINPKSNENVKMSGENRPTAVVTYRLVVLYKNRVRGP